MTSAPYRPGSKADFDRLYQASHGRLVATLAAMLRDRAEAEDCVQEAFVRAYRAWPNWSPDAPPEAWLHRIAVNVAISNRRKQRLRGVTEVIRRLGHPKPAAEPSAEVEFGDVVDALRRLPPKQAAAMMLRHYHGYTNREIASALGIPERRVASRLIAARGTLMRYLGPDWHPSAAGPPEMRTPLGLLVPGHGES